MRRLSALLACCLFGLASVVAYAEKSPGEHVDDSIMTGRVKLALLESSLSDAADINVETSKGVVQLSGFIHSEEAKLEAASVAAATEGVKDVSNRLTIQSGKRSPGRTLDDTILTSKVKLALAKEDSTAAMHINVEIRDGVVELSGFVNSYSDRDAAVAFVSHIDGVKSVINSMDITK